MSSSDKPEDLEAPADDAEPAENASIFDDDDGWDQPTRAGALADEEVQALFHSTASNEAAVDFSDFDLEDLPTRVGFQSEPPAAVPPPSSGTLPLGVLGDAEPADRGPRIRRSGIVRAPSAAQPERSLFSRMTSLFKRSGSR